MRAEQDSLGPIQVPANKYWGAQTQRAIMHFSIGNNLMPIAVIHAYGILKKAAAQVNQQLGLLANQPAKLIDQATNELIAGKLDTHFPLYVWMTGSGTQTNMNVNEVIANRACELAGQPLGQYKPVHPNDHVNMSQSTNDSFPTAMHIASARYMTQTLMPTIRALRDGLAKKSTQWDNIIKIGRTHLQDATPLTLGQEFSGYVHLLDENLARIEFALSDIYALALGGTAVGTGINTHPDFSKKTAATIAQLTQMPFVTAPNKFAVQGSHDALVMLSSTLRSTAVSLHKIANDIRLLACGPRCGLAELILPSNEPGSSIMPGKINPTQCEALAMVTTQVISNDVAISIGGSGGHLEMNVYKPLLIYNIMQSARILNDSCNNFLQHLVIGMQPNHKQIKRHLENSLMLVTALSPIIGYDKASHAAHHALNHKITLKDACLKLNYVDAETFDQVINPSQMIKPSDLS